MLEFDPRGFVITNLYNRQMTYLQGGCTATELRLAIEELRGRYTNFSVAYEDVAGQPGHLTVNLQYLADEGWRIELVDEDGTPLVLPARASRTISRTGTTYPHADFRCTWRGSGEPGPEALARLERFMQVTQHGTRVSGAGSDSRPVWHSAIRDAVLTYIHTNLRTGR